MTAVRIPADVDREDHVLAGLSARQLAILAVTAVVVWGVVFGTGRVLPVPLPLLVAAVVPVAALGTALALGRRDGLSGDRFALAALSFLRAPRRRVLAPEGLPPVPPWLEEAVPTERVGRLELPLRGADGRGVLDLGASGSAVVAAATPVNFSLRSGGEQEALVAAFGRFLHALSAPVQVLARAHRLDLSAAVAEVADSAPALPAPGLRDAAAAHAEFLAALAARRDLLRRETVVVFRHPRAPAEARDVLLRRLDEGAALLQGSSVTLRPLGRAEATALLRRCADPDAPPPPPGEPTPPGEPVRGTQ